MLLPVVTSTYGRDPYFGMALDSQTQRDANDKAVVGTKANKLRKIGTDHAALPGIPEEMLSRLTPETLTDDARREAEAVFKTWQTVQAEDPQISDLVKVLGLIARGLEFYDRATQITEGHQDFRNLAEGPLKNGLTSVAQRIGQLPTYQQHAWMTAISAAHTVLYPHAGLPEGERNLSETASQIITNQLTFNL